MFDIKECRKQNGKVKARSSRHYSVLLFCFLFCIAAKSFVDDEMPKPIRIPTELNKRATRTVSLRLPQIAKLPAKNPDLQSQDT